GVGWRGAEFGFFVGAALLAAPLTATGYALPRVTRFAGSLASGRIACFGVSLLLRVLVAAWSLSAVFHVLFLLSLAALGVARFLTLLIRFLFASRGVLAFAGLRIALGLFERLARFLTGLGVFRVLR